MPLRIAGEVWVEFAVRCGTVQTPEELLSLLVTTVGRLGYDHVNVSIMRDYGLPNDALKFGLANTYPDDWQAYYLDRSCLRFDPVAQYARGNGNPFYWADLKHMLRLTQLQLGFLSLAEEAGLNNGVGLPFPGARSLHGGIALATSLPQAERLQDLNILWSISNLFYKTLKELLLPSFGELVPTVDLTPREADILMLPARGETDKKIASILGISENTVNTHMRKIYRKLGAHNRIQAFSNAVKAQLIDLP